MSPAPERHETDGAAATEALGAQLAAALAGGDVVFVSGELGAGKTTFVRGACRALGVQVPVTSPTFAIGHRYPAAAGLEIAHLDLYRLDGLGAEDPDLIDGYLGPSIVTFVEWPPEHASPELGSPRLAVSLTHLGGDRRLVEVRR